MALSINFRLLSILFSFFVIYFEVDAGLEILVRNVGQGNCIAVKHGTKAILVDAGVHQSGGYRSICEQDASTDPILNFLKDCEVNVFISHTHYDHYSLLDYFFSNKDIHGINFGTVYCSDFAASNAYKTARKRWINNSHMVVKSVNSTQDLANIAGLLGDGVQIDAVIPKRWPTVGKSQKAKRSKDPNDNSLAIVVTDNIDGKKLLLTGDATGATLDQVIRDEANLQKLMNVDCIIVPHHGSNASGAFSWFHFVKDQHVKDYNLSLLALMSSDPTECDFLPWYGVRLFNCSRGIEPNICVSHAISTNAKGDDIVQSPVFVTSNSTGFFKILFRSGTVVLFDGEKSLSPVFSSNETKDSELEGESQLSQLLLRNNIGGAIAFAEKNKSDLTENMLLMLSSFREINEIRQILISTLMSKFDNNLIKESEMLLSLDYGELIDKVSGNIIENQAFLPCMLLKMSNLPLYRDFTIQILWDRACKNQLLNNTEEFIVAMNIFKNNQEYAAYISDNLARLGLNVDTERVWLFAIKNGYLTKDIVERWLITPGCVLDSIISQISIFAESSAGYEEVLKIIVQAKLNANIEFINSIQALNLCIKEDPKNQELQQKRDMLQDQLSISDALLENAMRFDDLSAVVAGALICIPKLSETVLLEAMKYEKFNDAIFQLLNDCVPFEESDFYFYIRHLKDFDNLKLLHQIVELPTEATFEE